MLLVAGLFLWLRPASSKTPVAVVTDVALSVDSDPPGADVVLGSERVGKTPLTLRRPRAEQVTLHLKKPGYHSADAFVTVAADQRITIKLEKDEVLPRPTAPPHVATATPSQTADRPLRGEVEAPSARGRKGNKAPRTSEPKVSGDELIQLQF
jgi:hypothetical protein